MDSISWYMSVGLVMYGLTVVFTVRKAPYGRFSRTGYGFFIPARVAWFVQELPGFLVPAIMAVHAQVSCTVCLVLLAMFMLHYFHRTFIFSLRISGGKPSPVLVVLSAFAFCSYNGFLQGHFLLHVASYASLHVTSLRFVLGSIIYVVGMVINIHSDSVLRKLRSSGGDKGYNIPRGGLFEYVSAANYFGEIVEWWGYGVAVNAAPGYAFAFFTTCMLTKRGLEYHQFYLTHFENYPGNRKAVIPFLL